MPLVFVRIATACPSCGDTCSPDEDHRVPIGSVPGVELLDGRRCIEVIRDVEIASMASTDPAMIGALRKLLAAVKTYPDGVIEVIDV